MPNYEQTVRRAVLRIPSKIEAYEAFANLQASKLIDPKWSTLEELNAAYIDTLSRVRAESKATGKELNPKEINALVRAKLGVIPPIFDKNGVNNRKLREIFPPELKKAIDGITGEGTVDKVTKLQGKHWKAAQVHLREVGEKIGMKLDIGHFLPHSFGAPQSQEAAGAEGSKINRSQGGIPRTDDYEGLRRNQVALNKAEGIYETILRADGLTEGMHDLVSVLFGSNADTRFISLDQAEMLSRRFKEIEDQGGDVIAVYNSIRETGKTDNDSLFRAAFEDQITEVVKQTKPKAPPKGTPLKVTRNGKLVRNLLKSLPIGAASLVLSQQDVQAREQEYRDNPNSRTEFQLNLARFSLAADLAGVAPVAAPIAEPAAMASSILNTVIDERDTLMKAGSEVAKVVKQYDSMVNAPQRAVSQQIGQGVRSLLGTLLPQQQQPQPKVAPKQKAKKPKLKIGDLEVPELGITEFLGFN